MELSLGVGDPNQAEGSLLSPGSVVTLPIITGEAVTSESDGTTTIINVPIVRDGTFLNATTLPASQGLVITTGPDGTGTVYLDPSQVAVLTQNVQSAINFVPIENANVGESGEEPRSSELPPPQQQQTGRPPVSDLFEIKPPVGKGPFSCSLCGKIFPKWNQLQRHVRNHAFDKPHRCDLCDLSFNVESNLVLHKATHNSNNPTCPECKRRFSRMASFKAHIMMHEKEESLMCNECGDEFSTLMQLDKHMRHHQDEEDGKKEHTCKRCNSTFGKASLLRDHMKVHYKIKASLSHRTYKRNIDRSAFNHKCNTCGKTFQKPSQLERHFRIHTGERPYTCIQCNKAFNQKGALQIHLTKHSGERPHRCEFCPAAFSQKGNLRAHIQRVHVIGNEAGSDLVMYSCEECTCVFKKLGSLNAHVSRMHSDDGEKPPKDGDGENGKEVREVIRQLMDLSAHIPEGDEGRQQSSTDDVLGANSDLLQQALQNSGLTENQSDPSLMASGSKVDAGVTLEDDPTRSQNVGPIQDITADEERPVSRFTNTLPKTGATHTMSYADTATGALKKHLIRKVAGIRWHQCLYCCKEFKKPSDLVRHIRIHTHEKPYKCGHCYRSFTVKSTLTAHLRTHTGIKNYRCQVCNKLFSTQGSLKVHLRLHTGAKPFDCPHCDKRFRTSGHRKSHLVSHSKDGVAGGGPRKPRRSTRRPPKSAELSTLPEVTLQEPILITDGGLVQSLPPSNQFPIEGPGPDRPYVCVFCSRAFKKSSHLKQHTRSHTGEKPYQCTKCLRRFVSGGVLKAHLRTHTGVRAYRCHTCDSAFTTNGSLKRHLSIHSEIRPFMCPYCQKTFKTSVNCKKHMKTHKHELALQAARATSEVETRETAPVTELGDPSMATASIMESALHERLVVEAANEPSMATDQSNVGLESRLVAAASATLVPQSITLTQENLQQLFSDQTPLTDTDLEPKTLQVVPVGSTPFDHQTFEQFSAFSMPPDQLQQTLDIAGLADTFVQSNSVMTGTTISSILSTQESGCQTLPDDLEGDNSLNKGDRRNYKCTYCSKCFKKSSHLKQHVRTHTGEKPFKCVQCHRMFVSMGVLRAHLRTHTGARDFKCHICQATFTTNGSLTRHKMIHSSARPFKCQYCNDTFRTTVHYKRHLRTHSGPMNDDQVHPSTQEEQDANVVERIREEEKDESGGGSQRKTLRTTFVQFSDEQTVNLAKQPPEECSTISEKILIASAVEKDRVSEIKDKREELQRLPRYPHMCKICPKSFKKPSDLVRHTRIHTGEKPFKCPQCDKCFTVKSTLDSHLKTHSGEKHFNCHVCNSMFATKGSLKVHMRLHTGAKPFKCPHCDQRFRTSGHRKSHITTHFKTSSVRRLRKPSTNRLMDRSQPQSGEKTDVTIQSIAQSQTEAKLIGNECDMDNQHVQEEEDAVAVVSEQTASGLLSCDDFQNQGLLQSVELLEGSGSGPQTSAASMLANITLSLDGLGPDTSHILDDGASEIQIAGLDGSSMITQTIQIDANLLQQLQQQGNINITINSILPPGLLEDRLALGQGISSQPQGGIQMTSPTMVGGSNIIYQPMNITFPLNTQSSQVLIPVDQGGPGDVLSVERHDPCFQMTLEPTVGVVESGDKDSMEVNLNIMETGEMVTKVQAVQLDGTLEKDHNPESRKLQQTPASRETYRCQSCNKSFKRNENLREHLLLAHGCDIGDTEVTSRNKVLPHGCGVCQKRFAKPSQLERHTRIHTGERPFECSVCHKTFNQTNALQVHMSRHTGERPHKCPYCQMAFSQKGNLNVHVRRVHGEGEPEGTQVVVNQSVDDGLDLVSDIFQP